MVNRVLLNVFSCLSDHSKQFTSQASNHTMLFIPEMQQTDDIAEFDYKNEIWIQLMKIGDIFYHLKILPAAPGVPQWFVVVGLLSTNI